MWRPLKVNGRADDGERPHGPGLASALSLARSTPRPNCSLWQLGCPCLSVPPRRFPDASTSVSLRTRNGTPHPPPTPHVTQRIMTKGLSPPGVLSPPRPLTARCPSVSPRACHCPVSCHTPSSAVSLLSPPGPVLALLSPPGPSPPSITSCHPPDLWWRSQQPWAHHRPMSCHPPGLSPPGVPPVTPRAVTTRCPLLSAASQGKTAWGRCSGLCRVALGCPHCRASEGGEHLSVFESILVHLWKVQSKKPRTIYVYCHKAMYFPTAAHPQLLELWRGGLQRKQ